MLNRNVHLDQQDRTTFSSPLGWFRRDRVVERLNTRDDLINAHSTKIIKAACDRLSSPPGISDTLNFNVASACSSKPSPWILIEAS